MPRCGIEAHLEVLVVCGGRALHDAHHTCQVALHAPGLAPALHCTIYLAAYLLDSAWGVESSRLLLLQLIQGIATALLAWPAKHPTEILLTKHSMPQAFKQPPNTAHIYPASFNQATNTAKHLTQLSTGLPLVSRTLFAKANPHHIQDGQIPNTTHSWPSPGKRNIIHDGQAPTTNHSLPSPGKPNKIHDGQAPTTNHS
eukprot:970523-Pelagomonas_calceolata.AAC.5